MKAKKWLSALVGTVLAWCIAVGGIGCLISAFSLEPENFTGILLQIGLWAGFAGAVLQWKHGGKCLLAVLALVLGYLLREGTVLLQIEKLVYALSTVYDKAYHWGVVYWSGEELAAVAVDGALTFLGSGIAMVAAWTVCRRKWVGIPLILGFLPLIACCVVTDSTPGKGWLLLLLVAAVLLILTNTTRRRLSAAEGNRLTAMLLIPVLLAGMLLFYLVPSEGYVAPEQDLLTYLQGLFTSGEGINISLGLSEGRVDLTTVGPKFQARYPVMYVVSDHTDKLYLRGQALDVYDGTSWSASENSSGKDLFWPKENLTVAGKVTVTLVSRHYYEYFPYYVDLSEAEFVNGSLGNGDRGDYAYVRMKLTDPPEEIKLEADAELRFPIVYAQNTQLPAETRQWAEGILSSIIGNGFGLTTEQIVNAVEVFVSATAAYDLDTAAMPEGKDDFARWFVEESDSGYCVHFATAAVVFLRAAGIPARYVSGYTANAIEGQRVTVTADKAHAWVEYLDNGVWRVLDPTPPDPEEPPETQAPTTEGTEPTDGTESQLPTLPDATTEPTEESTDPTVQTQGPTESTPGGNSGGGDPEEPVDLTLLWKVLGLLGGIAVLLGIALLQYGIRVKYRSKRMRTGHRNQRALHRWRYAKTMGRLTGKVPPEELAELAEKAVFSQHTLTVAELLEFDRWTEAVRLEIMKKPWPLRLAIRLIWAIE